MTDHNYRKNDREDLKHFSIFSFIILKKKLGVAYRSQAVLLSFGGNLRGDFPKFSQIDLELISRTFSARFHWRIIISIIYVDIFYRYIMQYSISLMWFVIFLTNSPCLIVEKNLVYIFFITDTVIYLVILIYITCNINFSSMNNICKLLILL